MSFVITMGRLVSTTDIKLARKLQQVIKLDDITKGATPEALRQSNNRLSFMLRGEYYELERAQ